MMDGAGSVRFNALPPALAQRGVDVLYVDGKWAAMIDPSKFDHVARRRIDDAVAEMNERERPSFTIDPLSLAAEMNHHIDDEGHLVPGKAPHTRDSLAVALSSLICRAESVLNDLRALKALV